MTACEGKEELSYPVYLDWGLQAIFKIASKMPDLASKVTVLREVMSMFQGSGSAAQPQEEVKVDNEEASPEELHCSVIEGVKDFLTEYLQQKDELLQILQTEDKKNQAREDKFEEIRQQNENTVK